METTSVPKENTTAPPVKAKRVMTDKQRAGLQKGMDALKAKREQMSQEKEERKKTNEVLKEKGLPPVEPPLKIKGKDIQVVVPVPEPVEIKLKERKVRADKGKKHGTELKVTRQEFDELKTHLRAVPTPAMPVSAPIIERVVEKVVEKEKVLSGNALLDRIFFNK